MQGLLPFMAIDVVMLGARKGRENGFSLRRARGLPEYSRTVCQHDRLN